MPKVDLTITVSVILAVCAIVSPVLTTLINNRYQLKLKRIDMKLEQEKASYFYKRGIYEDYLKITGKCVTYASQEALQEYGQTYSLALIYFPDDLIPEIVHINNCISVKDWSQARTCLTKLAPKIRTMLEKL